MLNKKGVTNLIIVIAVILIGVILIIFSTSFLKETTRYGLREACLQCVQVAGLSQTLRGGKAPSEDFNCGTYYYAFDNEKKQDILQTIADEMFWCYWQFGAGKVDFLTDYIWANSSKCYVCAQMTFSDQARANFPNGIQLNELLNYLNVNNIPIGDEKYAEYILDKKGSKYELDPNNKNNFPLDEEYWVVFNVVKEGALANFYKNSGMGSQITAGGLGAASMILFAIPGVNVVWGIGLGAAAIITAYTTGAKTGGADRLYATVNLNSKKDLDKICGELRPFPAYEAN